MNLKNYQQYLTELKVKYNADKTMLQTNTIKNIVVKSPNGSLADDWNNGHLTIDEFNHLKDVEENQLTARFVAVNLKDNGHVIIFGNAKHHIHVGLFNYLDEFLLEQSGFILKLAYPNIDKNGQLQDVPLSKIPDDYIKALLAKTSTDPKKLLELDSDAADYLGKSYKSKSVFLGFVHIIKNKNNILIRPDVSDSDELNKTFISSNFLYNQEYAGKLASQIKRKSFLDKFGNLDNLKNDWEWLDKIIPNYIDSLKT